MNQTKHKYDEASSINSDDYNSIASGPDCRPEKITAVILAGGKASRMGGVNKALLKINGKSIIEREIEVLDAIFDETIIITNNPENYEFLGKPLFNDVVPGKGSLGGLYTGLLRARNHYSFFVPCDMPFLDTRIINVLLSKLDNHDIVIPKINGHLEPMHAIYSKKCIPHIKKLMTGDDLKIKLLFHEVDTYEISEDCVRKFDPAFDFIMNVNTPKDFEDAKKKLVSKYG